MCCIRLLLCILSPSSIGLSLTHTHTHKYMHTCARVATKSCAATAYTLARYYMEHKIFQHLLELKSLQIRSNKVNEAVLVKRAVDDYHKSTMLIGAETGGFMRRYPYKEYTFKNFEIFLYEVLKSLQKTGTNNFQNISDVYLEVS